MGFFSDDNNTNETVWDIVNTVPVLGNVVSGVNVVQDAYGVATESGEAQAQALRDLAQDGLGFLPGVGNALSMGRVMYDMMAPNDNAHDLMDQMLGGPGGTEHDPACDPEVGGRYNYGDGAQCYDDSVPRETSAEEPQQSEYPYEDEEVYGPYAE